MTSSLGSAISSPTVFGPMADKLSATAQKLNIITQEVSEFRVSSYKSLQEFVTEFKLIQADIRAQIAVVVKQLDASLATMTSAQHPASGTALAAKNMAWCVQEIQAAIKCFTSVTQIISGLVAIVLILSAKVLELGRLLVTLSLDAVTKYLAELKTNIVTTINNLKASVVSHVSIQILTKKGSDARQSINATNKLISNRQKILSSAGADSFAISQDTQIKSWNNDILNKQALLKELSEFNLATGYTQI